MQASDEFPFGPDFDWHGKIFLGEGAFGKVFKVLSRRDGQYYAIKQMIMQEMHKDPALMKALQGQIAITSDVSSEHTVKMIAHSIGHKYTYIILQLCDSDLRKEITKRQFTQPETVKVFQEILLGFQIMVNKGYIHRDIKPANILVKNSHYKVADFGFATKADILGRKRMTDVCGTPLYMAPQLLKNQPYTAKSDIWSLGLMMYELIFGYPPWPCRSLKQYLNGILYSPLKFPYNGKIGTHTKDFIKRSLVVNQNERMSWNQVFAHPLVKNHNTGQEISNVQVNSYVKQILVRIQNDVQKRGVNLNEILAPYANNSLSVGSLTELIKRISPSVTTHEIHTLFSYLDPKKEGWIDWNIVQQKIFLVDFRESNDVLSRKIDEMANIFKNRGERPQILFDKIDTNHSGFLDFGQFSRFILHVAPAFTKDEIFKFFALFDADKNGLISKSEFVNLIVEKMPDMKAEESVGTERGRRNLKEFVDYLKWSSVSAETFIKIADRDRNGVIDMKEFEQLLNRKLSFNISFQEVEEVFKIIDKSRSGSINVHELAALMK